MKIRILTKKRTKTAAGLNVYIAIYGIGKTEMIYTGHCVPVKEWDAKANLPKDHSGQAYKDIKKIDGTLTRLTQLMEGQSIPITPQSLKIQYMDWVGANQAKEDEVDARADAGKITVVKLIEQYLSDGILHMRPSTRITVKSSMNKFTSFLKAKKLASLDKRQLNSKIIVAYQKDLVEQKLSINNRAKLLKQLKTFLKFIQYDKSPLDDIKIVKVSKPIISLTLEELKMLEAVDCSKHSKDWQKAKDVFLIGAYTGLRLSDIRRINPINSRGGFITLNTLKNSKNVQIPIMEECKEILERNNYHSPKMAANKVNAYIKKVCCKAKINQLMIVEHSEGDKVTTKTVQKWEVITSHVSSKTFITLAPERWGMAPAEIAHLVGKHVLTLINHYFNDQAPIAREKMIANNKPYMKVATS